MTHIRQADLEGARVSETRDKYIARRTSDDPLQHTNLHPRDLDAMRFLLEDIKVTNANLKGWRDASNLWHDEYKAEHKRFEAHTAAVADFLNELWAIMVDPLAEGVLPIKETLDGLREAALRARQADHECPPATELLNQNANLRERLTQANKLQELTLDNEMRWMRKHDDLLKLISTLRDWKSPDSVLQVKDLKWFKDIECQQ